MRVERLTLISEGCYFDIYGRIHDRSWHRLQSLQSMTSFEMQAEDELAAPGSELATVTGRGGYDMATMKGLLYVPNAPHSRNAGEQRWARGSRWTRGRKRS